MKIRFQDTLLSYHESEDIVRHIYETDLKDGNRLSLSVAMARHVLESAHASEMEGYLKERALDEIGAALIRELLKHEGKDLRVVATQVTHHDGVHRDEFRHLYDVHIYPLTRIP